MKSKLFIVSFTLFFFNSANAICVPRNRSVPSPSPHTPPNLKPVSSSPKAPTPSSPAPKLSSLSSPKAPTPSSPAPKSSSLSSPKAPTPSSPAPKSSSSSSPKAPAPSSPALSSSSSSPKDSIPSSPALSSSSPPKDSTPASPAPKASSPITAQSFIKNPINTITSALPKPGRGGDNPDLKKICNSTDYPDVCLSTLGPLAGLATDAPSVLRVAIKAGLDFAKTAQDTAQRLATKPGTPPDVASSIKDCKDSYDDVSYNFQNAADALPKKDIGTMNTMLSAALTDVEDCNDAFEGRVSPLTTISDTLRKMASNSLAIIDVMNKP